MTETPEALAAAALPKLSALIEREPSLRALSLECSKKSLKLFLSGGTVRDALLQHAGSSDYDLLIEGDKNAAEAVRNSFLKSARNPKSFDIKFTGNAAIFVQQYDLRINSILYDVQAKSFASSAQGIEDAAARVLKPNTEAGFVTGPSSFFRVFRLALELKLSVDPALLSLINHYQALAALGPPRMRTQCLREVFRIFSHKEANRILPAFFRSGLLRVLFPALHIFREDFAREFTSSQANEELALLVEQTLFGLAPQSREALLKSLPLGNSDPSEPQRMPLNVIGLARLSALFLGLGTALQALNREPHPQLSGEPHAQHSAQALLHFGAAYASAEDPSSQQTGTLGSACRALIPVSLIAHTCIQNRQKGVSFVEEQIGKVADPAAAAATALLILTRSLMKSASPEKSVDAETLSKLPNLLSALIPRLPT